MIEYNVEKKKVEEAIQQVYRDFALKYGEIQKSELSEVEKLEQIDYLLEVAISKDEILRNTRSLSELSSQDKEDLEIKEESETKKVDTNVIDTLVSVYAKRAKIPSNRINGMGILDGITLRGEEELEEIDTSAFEEELRQYFTEHYFDLLSNGYNNFLSDVTEVSDNTSSKNGELIEMAIKHGLDPKKFNCFGYQLTVQDGLVAEEDSILGSSNIFYASPEAINKRIYDLYSETLFQEQKSNGKDFFLNDGRKLKNVYITYAEKNEIEIQDKDVLEELPIDMNKVQGIATYINRVLNENGTISNEDIDKLAIKKLESIIFELTDSLGKKNIKEALDVMHNLIYSKEPIQKIFITLYNHFKKLYFVTLAQKENRDIIQVLNLKPNQTFLVNKYKMQAKYFKQRELEKILQELIDLDFYYKIGQIDIQVGLEAILCTYCS